jgi:FtsP/CotA-like multicopper oxidase with cupredoxin domain
MLTRRRFIRVGTLGAVGLYAGSQLEFPQRVFAQVPGGTLSPYRIPKFVTPLVIPPAMPCTASTSSIDSYIIAARQFRQQVLPPPLPATTVWSYGAADDPRTFFYPAYTIEAVAERPLRVKWINGLVDRRGAYLPHLLPIDQTLHWANPPGGVTGRDMHGSSAKPYTGPVPLVPHLHGGHTFDDSDGFPEAWFLPAATDIPSGYATEGTWYNFFAAKYSGRTGDHWEPGSATSQYSNDQRATTLWYHDHALGMTRANVYAGLAGFYLIRGGTSDLQTGLLPGPAPSLGDPDGTNYYEIPIVIQDRAFDASGLLFYPDSRAFFEELHKGQLQIPFSPEYACDGPPDVPPIWNPEFFGNVMVVNGRSWPSLDVEPRRYRFRFLNGCNSRTLILKFANSGLRFWQIGGDGGFMPAPVELGELLLGPAERADVVVDFTGLPEKTELTLINVGPDEPFGGGEPDSDFDPADPESTGLVMQFRIVSLRSEDSSTSPRNLVMPSRTPLDASSFTRRVSLNELESSTVEVFASTRAIRLACDNPEASAFGPTAGLLGTVDAGGSPNPLRWDDGLTENPNPGATETWEIHNHTADAHPVHLHMVQFDVLERADILTGVARPPEPWETGPKDTVLALPGEITRVKATFDLAGQYVWHCHILEHEDNEMMRPYSVGPEQDPSAM